MPCSIGQVMRRESATEARRQGRSRKALYLRVYRGLIVRRMVLASVVAVLAVTVSAKDCSTSKKFTIQHSQKLSGVFVDKSGAALPGIGVQLLSGKKVIRDTHADSQGVYDLGNVPPGTYQIRIAYHHAFCAPRIQCSSNECKIQSELEINPKHSVVVL